MNSVNNKCNFSILICLFVFACDLAEPDRYYNSKPDQPQKADIKITGLTSRHVAGALQIEFKLDTVSFPIRRVDCFLDSVLIKSWSAPPYVLTINTSQKSQGNHLIRLGLIASNMGLYSLTDGYSLTYSLPVVFDQTPPTSVTLQSITWDQGHTLLSWTQNNDSNFYAYIVERLVADNGYRQDTIFDRLQTSYRDTDVTQAYSQLAASYDIMVSNHAQAVNGNIMSIGYGDTLTTYPFTANGVWAVADLLVPHPSKDETYIYDNGDFRVKAISSITHQVLRSRTFYKMNDMQLQGDTLYILSGLGDKFYRMNVNDFEVDSLTSPTQYAFSGSVFARGRPDRTYVFGVGMATVRMSTGDQLNYTLHQGHFYKWTTEVSADKEFVFAQPPGNVLYKMDVTTDAPQLASSVNIGAYNRKMKLRSDLNRLFIRGEPSMGIGNKIEILNPATMTVSQTFQLQPNGSYFYRISDFFLTTDYMYVSYEYCKPNTIYSRNNSGKVLRVRLSDMAVTGSWEFFPFPEHIVVPRSETVMYVYTYFGNKAWLVPTN